MQTISLADILEKGSGDASGYDFCETCGRSQEQPYDWTIYQYVNGTCDLCGDAMRTAEIVGEILDAKRRDPWYAELRENIRANGMTTPVFLPHDVYNGHHRIAVAADLGMSVIPYTTSALAYSAAEMESDWEEGSEDYGY